ncbi:MAG: hypothetical protein UY04_C0013G0018 [Parcubacteria group bacterium GW2011_GWA2_47_7]|nr:MAG: hypothetical protein UY04_C0013G0018 [Parcubacteria group bacterium GW2011_GWA2_47_7]
MDEVLLRNNPRWNLGLFGRVEKMRISPIRKRGLPFFGYYMPF